MNRTVRSLIALTSATALTASVAVAAHAAQVDIGDDDVEIAKDNTLWTIASWKNAGFVIDDALIFAGPIDPDEPFAGERVNGDAFDGALSIFVQADEDTAPIFYGRPDDESSYFVGITENGDTLVQAPVEALLGLEVSAEQRFYAAGDMARVLATYTNPTDEPITVITGAYSNYGSDSYTTLEDDSSGDDSVSEADHWIVTGDDEDSDDPIVTKAWSTPGATLLPGFATLGYADDNGGDSVVAFELTVQPGQTIRLAYFVKIHGWESVVDQPAFLDGQLAAASIASGYSAAVAAAITDAAEFGSFSGRLTAGLANGTVVLNWGTVGGAVPADPAAPATPVPGRPTFTG